MFIYAQLPSYRNFTVKDGLPSNLIYQTCFDKKGMLWMGTDAGLCRYDGNNFITYTTQNGLSGNDVIEVICDEKGRVWAFPYLKNPCYYENGKFTEVEVIKYIPEKFKNQGYIINPIIDPNGYIWGHYFYSRNQNSIVRISANDKPLFFNQDTNGTPLKLILKISPDNGTEVINNKHEICFIKDSTVHITKEKISEIIEHEYSLSHFEKAGDKLYTHRSQNGLIEIDEYNAKKINIGIKLEEKARSFKLYFTGILWICTEKGAIGIDINTRKQIAHLFQDLAVTSVRKDFFGNLWFSTYSKGLQLIPKGTIKHFNKQTGLNTDAANSILNDQYGRIWIGGIEGEINVLMKDSLLFSDNVLVRLINGKLIKGMRVNSITSHKDLIYFLGDGSRIYNLKTLDDIVLKNYSTGSIKSVFALNDTTIYFAGSLGLYLFKRFSFVPNYIDEVPLKRIQSIYFLNDTLWIGTQSGLYTYSKGICKQFSPNNKSLTIGIFDIKYNKKDKSIWLSSETEGLIRLKGGAINYYSEKIGLPSNNCKKIHIDIEGNIWVATNKGIAKIKYNSGSFSEIVKFSTADGLISDNTREITSSGNRIWVATLDGVSSFYPDSIDTREAPLYIDKIKINGRDTLLNNDAKIPFSQNNVSFNFTAISYRFEGKLNYRYQLLPVEGKPILTTNNSANYPALPAGEYTFKVWAQNKNGIWNSKPITYSFTILPPWYETWWFRISVLAIIALAVYLFINYRIRTIRAEEQKKTQLNKEIAELKMTALRSQMNPHFVFNALNSVYRFVLENDAAKATRYLADFAHLVRKVFDYSGNEYILLAEEIEILTLYLKLEKMRLKDHLDYHIQIDETISPNMIEIPPLLVQPYVENALIHGISNLKERSGKIDITFVLKEDIIECTVTDNGIGRINAAKLKKELVDKSYKSAGMNITEKRLKILNEEKQYETHLRIVDLEEDGVACGTKISIYIPMRY